MQKKIDICIDAEQQMHLLYAHMKATCLKGHESTAMLLVLPPTKRVLIKNTIMAQSGLAAHTHRSQKCIHPSLVLPLSSAPRLPQPDLSPLLSNCLYIFFGLLSVKLWGLTNR